MQETTCSFVNLKYHYEQLAKYLDGSGDLGLDILAKIWNGLKEHPNHTSKMPKEVRILQSLEKETLIIVAVQKAAKHVFGENADFSDLTRENAVTKIYKAILTANQDEDLQRKLKLYYFEQNAPRHRDTVLLDLLLSMGILHIHN